jgi:hypothetical protein
VSLVEQGEKAAGWDGRSRLVEIDIGGDFTPILGHIITELGGSSRSDFISVVSLGWL